MNFFLASDYEVRWRHLAKRAGQPHAFAGVNDIGDDAPGMVRGSGRGNLVDAVAESERSAVSRISGMGADVDILRMRIDSFQCSGGGSGKRRHSPRWRREEHVPQCIRSGSLIPSCVDSLPIWAGLLRPICFAPRRETTNP